MKLVCLELCLCLDGKEGLSYSVMSVNSLSKIISPPKKVH